MTVTPVE